MADSKNLSAINEAITNVINDYTNKGYQFIYNRNINNDKGSGDAISLFHKADAKLIVVYIEDSYTEIPMGKLTMDVDSLIIKVVAKDDFNQCSTTSVWASDMTPVLEIPFIKVGGSNCIYMPINDDSIKATQLHSTRYRKYYPHEPHAKMSKVPLSVDKKVRARYGFKKTTEIMVETYPSYYHIYAKNKNGKWVGMYCKNKTNAKKKGK